MPFPVVFFERKNPVPQLFEDVNRENEGGGWDGMGTKKKRYKAGTYSLNFTI